MSTDKVDSEVPSPSAGYLSEILVEEGDTVDVGTKIAVLADAPPGEGGGGEAAAGGESEDEDQGEAEAEPAAEEEPAGTDDDAEASEPDDSSDEEEVAEEAETAVEEEPAPAAETETAGEPEAEASPATERSGSSGGGGGPSGGGPLLSPVVRRLLDDAGVDASEVSGTGVGGRITRSDVEEHLRSGRKGSEAPAAPAASASPPPKPTSGRPAPASPRVASAAAAAVGSEDEVALNKIRTITAAHMVRSLQTSAHAYVSTEVDFEAVERVRSANQEQFHADEGISLTYLPFVSRALIDALAEFPQVNASMGEETSKLVVHGSVHLGIAVDLDYEGLIVPVVHDAQDQRLRAIARHVADLAGRARTKKLGADEISGGTVTITNVGSTGNAFLLPIINQPQVMILATDGVARKPVVVTSPEGDESIAIHSVGNLTLGWDHRAFDGAYAARFLALVKEILETRDWSAEL